MLSCGTLGMENHDKITSSIKQLLRRRKLSKIFIIGDLNLNSVSWDRLTCSSPIEQSFVDSFVDLGLVQCVSKPTHCKGKTLDILLTNTEASIADLKVLENDSICKADHFPITFKIVICKYISGSRPSSVHENLWNETKFNFRPVNSPASPNCTNQYSLTVPLPPHSMQLSVYPSPQLGVGNLLQKWYLIRI